MKKLILHKKVFYILIILFVSISLLGTAALCNMCGKQDEGNGGTDKIDIDRTDNTKNNSQQTAADNDKTTDEDNQDQEEQSGRPVIQLKIYEGPIYSEADDVCYYRIEATVTGSPIPEITWSKDDSKNAFGDYKAQVNLTRKNPSYTLIATATNSVDTVTESIDLSWGCGGEVGNDNNNDKNNSSENANPQILSINLSENIIYAGEVYAVTAKAADPDGDSLSYEWSTTDGKIANDNVNPMIWTAPDTAGSYTIYVIVKDGNGGQATGEKTVTVLSY